MSWIFKAPAYIYIYIYIYKGYFLEIDVPYSEQLHDLQNDLPISKWKPKKMKNVLANFHDKKEDVINKK